MKLKNLFNLIAIATALATAAVGCKKNPGYMTKLPPGQRPGGNGPLDNGQNITPGPGTSDQAGTAVTTGNLAPNDPTKHQGWPEDTEALKAQTIYFEYDKSSIKSSEDAKLDQVGDYLKSHTDVAIRIEGNCDERGTEEYNRSLGERRALAAREYLVRLSIDPGRIDTISYGKDRPLDSEHNTSGWSKNRRDDFVVLTPPKVQ